MASNYMSKRIVRYKKWNISKTKLKRKINTNPSTISTRRERSMVIKTREHG